MVEIRNIHEEVIFTSETAQNIKDAVEEAVRLKVSLAYADLSRCDLSNGNFQGGDFKYANFMRSNLRKSIFRDAILTKSFLIDADYSQDTVFTDGKLDEAIRSFPQLYDELEAKETKKMETEEIEKKENYMLRPPIIKEAEVLQPLEIMVTGKDNPYHAPGHTVFFRGVEFRVEENKLVETSTTKSQRIKLILK